MVVMFMLVQATNNRQLYEQYYLALLGVNVGAAVLLLLVIGWIVVRLFMRLRRGKFGSRLLIKLAAIFAMVGLLPGAMIYVVSYQFVSLDRNLVRCQSRRCFGRRAEPWARNHRCTRK